MAKPKYDRRPTLPHGNSAKAYEAYAKELDEWAPGWHLDDLDLMDYQLAQEALKRRVADS